MEEQAEIVQHDGIVETGCWSVPADNAEDKGHDQTR
jgi:hypothetical protein